MCSRYSLTSPPEAVRAMFAYKAEASPLHAFPPRYNIAPTQPVAIVRVGASHARELALVRWGLIPGWVKAPGDFATLLNARAETILEKPSFKSAMRYRRCIVPADAYYEWTGPAGAKVPHMVRPKAGAKLAAPMGLAAVWEHWMGAEGSELESVAIITLAANATLASLHDRMPAILSPDNFDAWLDIRGVKDREAAELLKPGGDDDLEVITVGRRLNNPLNDDPEVQNPAGGTLP